MELQPINTQNGERILNLTAQQRYREICAPLEEGALDQDVWYQVLTQLVEELPKYPMNHGLFGDWFGVRTVGDVLDSAQRKLRAMTH